ncbi:MAG: hypothetical protein JNN08_01030 [Bryobacterales bacterium]|nr:hypothetical protein [Bryobacterales bacterium]
MVRALFFCFLLLAIHSSLEAQYSDDLPDARTSRFGLHAGPGTHSPTPIGDLGAVELVVDLRGFVPMAFLTKSARIYDSLFFLPLRWYKVPTRKALLMLYFGDITSDEVAASTLQQERQRFAATRFLSESAVEGEARKWCNVAYDLARGDSGRVFEQVVGGSYDAAEPTTVFFTKESVFVLTNFKYTQINVADKGQVLMAMEFSRSNRSYKTLYYLYSTTIASKSTREILAATGPYVAKAVMIAFGL